MAKLNYRNWFINCRPLKDNEGNWQLELEKGEIVHTFTMAKSMTVGSIENFAYDRIDEYVEDEIKS
jgi:hypothetical protein|tara:strand:+ start:2338 stop:2535 length:198 start_codon:yes stop_codon:yes gene_type:complete